MAKAYIIHGAYGTPQENWFPWLKTELEALDYEVIVPQFPTPEEQTLENWKKIWNGDDLDEESILIGHSIGPAFLLKVLENLNHPIKAAFLVSGFIKLLGNETFDPINKTFVEGEFNWERIKSNCKKFFAFHSDNDPYVPLEKGERLAEKLGIKITLIKGAAHINGSAGYTEFPELLEKIKSVL